MVMQIKHLVCVILHIKRANYQTMVWNKALKPCPSLPKPEDSGWYYSEGLLKPKLMTREEVLAACLQLAYCPTQQARETRAQTDAALAFNYLFAAPRHVNVATGAETTGTLQQRRMKHNL